MARETLEERFARFLREHPHAPQNEQRFAQMLQSVLPRRIPQTSALLGAWKAGIAEELESMRNVDCIFAARFTRKLVRDQRLQTDLAAWAVRQWLLYYGRDILGRRTNIQESDTTAAEVDPAAIAAACLVYRSVMGGKTVAGCRPPVPGTLIVPGRYDDMPVRSVAAGAFRGADVRIVLLAAGVRSIEGQAFEGCGNLRQVVLPTGLEAIGTATFADCPLLQFVSLPDSLVRIGARAFAGALIEEIIIGERVTWLGEGVFEGCTALRHADVGLGVQNLPARIFADCVLLRTVELPPRLERINAEAFADCAALQALRIPDSVRHIEDGAFLHPSEGLRLVGRRKSAAQYYAQRHGLQFQEIF